MGNLVIETIIRYYVVYSQLEVWTGVAASRLNYLSNADLIEHLEECIIAVQNYFNGE